MQSVTNPQKVGQVVEIFFIQFAGATGNFVCQLDIMHGVQGWQQVEFLKNEANLLFAQTSPLGIVQAGEVHAIDYQVSRGGPGQTANTVKQGRLSTSRRANDTDKLSWGHRKGDRAESVNIHFACVIYLAESIGDNNWLHSVFIVPVDPLG